MHTGKIVLKASLMTLFIAVWGTGCNSPSDALTQSKSTSVSNASASSSNFSPSLLTEPALLNSTLVSINQNLNISEQYLLSTDDVVFLKTETGLSDEELDSLKLFVKN